MIPRNIAPVRYYDPSLYFANRQYHPNLKLLGYNKPPRGKLRGAGYTKRRICKRNGRTSSR